MSSSGGGALEIEQIHLEQQMFEAGRDALAKADSGRWGGCVGHDLQRQFLKEAFEGILTTGKSELVAAISEQVAPQKRGRRSVLRTALAALAPETIAYTALRVLLNEDFEDLTQQSAALRIGEALEFEARLQRVRTQHPEIWETVDRIGKSKPSSKGMTIRDIKRLLRREEVKSPLPREQILRLGNMLLLCLLEYTDLFKLLRTTERDGGSYKRANFIVLSEKALTRIARRDLQLIRNAPPVYGPMIAEPSPWTSLDEGGYRTIPMSAIKPRGASKFDRAYRREVARGDQKGLLAPLNHLQQTAWRINEQVLEQMQSLALAPLIQRAYAVERDRSESIPLSQEEAAAAEETNAVVWFRSKVLSELGEQDEIQGQAGLRAFERITASGRNLQSGRQPFYFVWQLDFRGRAYPRGNQLQPQGQDAARALLLFDERRPLGASGERWLALHGANMLSVTSAALDDRIQDVYRREDEILAIASDPVGTASQWLFDEKAKSRPRKRAWRMLAFCLEWARLKREGSKFQSGMPVSMDGTCNAIQHFAAMLRDPLLGRLTNLTSEGVAYDVYSDVARRTCLRIRDGAACAEKEFLDKLGLPLDQLIDRGLCKQPVMTRSYGITEFGMIRQIRESLKQSSEFQEALERGKSIMGDGVSESTISRFIARQVRTEVELTLERAIELMKWLQSCAGLLIERGQPVRWTTPCGFPVMQAYQKSETVEIKTELSRLRKFASSTLKMKQPIDKLSERKARSAIAANFVHSHDASHMMRTVMAAKSEGITSLRMVHDAFATHADNADTLAHVLRREFVDMYEENDVLQQFYDTCCAQLEPTSRTQLQSPPQKGTLSLSSVLNSPYFFA